MQKTINALSLFANVGIAETYLKEIGINVVVANEIDMKRAMFYSHLYPETHMIVGDITDKDVQSSVLQHCIEKNVELIIATPPCQGMSSAGKKDKKDVRNSLICHVVDILKKIKPKYAFIENVPEQLKTKIIRNGKEIFIPDYIKTELENDYEFNKKYLVNAENYGVPQNRERAIFLLVRKDVGKKWSFPQPFEYTINLQEAIGHLPSLDPIIYDADKTINNQIFPEFHNKLLEAQKVSKWHYPPKHVYRQVRAMIYTPTGQSAFDNKDEYKPKKLDGTLVKGFKNTYKRQSWDKPGFTVTMYNRTIGSQDNVHPGRCLGKDKEGNYRYSDPRVLTIYELLIISSLPLDWNIPTWASDNFIRQVIGEGIPPLLVKHIMKELIKIDK